MTVGAVSMPRNGRRNFKSNSVQANRKLVAHTPAGKVRGPNEKIHANHRSSPADVKTQGDKPATGDAFMKQRIFAVWAVSAVSVISLSLQIAQGQTQPAPSSPGSSGELQEIIVTGSLIKRTDSETPSPVQIISSVDMQNSGYTNVSDVLRNLSSNGQGALSQSFGQAFGAGGAGVALRGLTVGGTLTLIDSERMVAYPLNDDGQRSFVDVTAIPFNAIDSVEVLKDGASAVYGADAIAGVVIIKLKKTYVGSEFAAEAGTSQHGDGTTEHLSV